MKIKTFIAWTGIFFLSVIPAILLFILGPRDYSSVTHTLGQVSGLIGMTMFALTFILSTRAKWIEYLFDGLDKVYPVHAVLGATSLVLLLMHPVFLVMKYIPENFQLAAKYLLPGGLLSVDFGIFALLGMIVLLMITLYSNIKYHRWKLSHEFLGLFFILAILHVILVRESVARDYIFQGYYVYATIVSVIGLSGFMYSLMRTRLLGKKYRIKSITPLNQCNQIVLEPIDNAISFKAGQFIFIKFLNKKVGTESHPFSIAAPSDSKEIRVIAKNLGDFTSNLGNLRVGNYAIVEGPYGGFHNKDFADEVWVAGGIGITPFLGLARDFQRGAHKKSDMKAQHVDLYYSVKSKDEFVCLEELQDIAKSNKSFRVYPWISSEKGYLDIAGIEKNSRLKGKEYYLCGPASLKDSIKKGLIQKNIPKNSIYDERFAFK